MKIETMDLKLIGQTEEEELLTKVTLKVRVFYQALPKTLAAVDSPLLILTEKETEVLKKISSFRTFPALQADAPTGKENLFSLP